MPATASTSPCRITAASTSRARADLVEEVARIDGVDKLPATLQTPARAGVLTHEQRVQRRAEDVLAGRGLFEVAGWSFAGPDLLEKLRLPEDSPLRDVVEIENPMSQDENLLRPSILGSLLDAAQHNIARGMPDLGLFESGAVYHARDEGPLPHEHHALAALVTGRLRFEGWRGGDGRPADYFVIKAILAAVLDTLRVDWAVRPEAWPFLHPGRSAAVEAGGEMVGFVGEVHPLVARAWDIDAPVTAFAIDLGKVAARAPEVTLYRDLTSYPSVRQDIAVVVADDVPAAEVLRAVREAGGEMLAHAGIFDVYEGEQLGEGRRSLAVHLEFRAPDRT